MNYSSQNKIKELTKKINKLQRERNNLLQDACSSIINSKSIKSIVLKEVKKKKWNKYIWKKPIRFRQLESGFQVEFSVKRGHSGVFDNWKEELTCSILKELVNKDIPYFMHWLSDVNSIIFVINKKSITGE